MSDFIADPCEPRQLRQEALHHLKAGSTPPSRTWGIGTDALVLLHRLASTPANAADALKLLHELQVHQVELDLQNAQLDAIERELGSDLARYTALFEFAPLGYFVLDPDGLVLEVNRVGAGLLGVEPGAVGGRPIGSFLAPDSQPLLAGLLERLRAGSACASCEVRPGGSGYSARPWRIAASSAPGSGAVLLMVVESDQAPGA
jgi:PAS domain-containing protein